MTKITFNVLTMAQTNAYLLINIVFSCFDLLISDMSDKETQFTSEVMQQSRQMLSSWAGFHDNETRKLYIWEYLKAALINWNPFSQKNWFHIDFKEDSLKIFL